MSSSKPIVFVKQVDIEGPDTFAEFFLKKGISTRVIDLHAGDALPDQFDDIAAAVILGGPMNVYQEDLYPFLKEEDRFIRGVIARQIPFIGICLGSQLLAKACAGKVVASPEKEIGFFPVRLNKQGLGDPLFAGLNDEIDAFHWHQDMSRLPEGAALLASSDGCPHQAFKIGTNAYGLQFHIEVTEPTVRAWTDTYFSLDDIFQMNHKRVILDDFRRKEKTFQSTADTIYHNFLNMIKTC